MSRFFDKVIDFFTYMSYDLKVVIKWVLIAIGLGFTFWMIYLASTSAAKNLNKQEPLLGSDAEIVLNYKSEQNYGGIYILTIYLKEERRHQNDNMNSNIVIVNKKKEQIESISDFRDIKINKNESSKDNGGVYISENFLYNLDKNQKIKVKIKNGKGYKVSFKRAPDEFQNIILGRARSIEVGAVVSNKTKGQTCYYKFTTPKTGDYMFSNTMSTSGGSVEILNILQEPIKSLSTFPSKVKLVGGIEYIIKIQGSPFEVRIDAC